jgi:hypothetical protein
MTGAELAIMPADVRQAIERSAFYAPCQDGDVQVDRQAWHLPETPPSRILAVCPTLRLEPETLTALLGLDWPHPIDWYLTRDNPYSQEVQRGYLNIWHNMTKARAHFLAGNYDAMLVVESDIVPPADALQKLAGLDGDVCGGLYVMRHGTPVPNAFVYVPGQTNPGTYIERWELRDLWGRVARTNGVCLGCCLIHRRVLEVIPFRMHEYAAPDWAFMEDCNARGLVTLCDLSVACGHIRPDGVTLWPDPDKGWVERLRDEVAYGVRVDR